MNIREIIQLHYTELLNSCSRPSQLSFSNAKTKEDVLNNICLTAIKKFNNKTITEEEGLTYLKKNYYTELKYCLVRFDPLTLVENYNDYNDIIGDYDE